jgi:rhodanese-related sulfurtransferase/polyisoprenoid-binding protein YceI
MAEDKIFPTIDAEEMNERLKKKEPILLIDTLTGIHFEKVHLPGARNACVFEVSFLEQVSDLVDDKSSEIVLYGSSSRSMDAVSAAEKLRRAGYENVSILSGGLETWRASGYELDGDHPDMADPETLLQLDDGTYTVDIDQSLIEWSGRNPNTKHYGTVGLTRGQVEVNRSIISGVFEIDMNSIDNTNLKGDELHSVLISHLKSDDFFFIAMFPQATLTINKGLPVRKPYLSAPNYRFDATLEIRGVKAELPFEATVTKTEEGGLAAEAHFDIDRTQWEVIYGSTRFFENIGMHLVFDLISFQVKILTNKLSN